MRRAAILSSSLCVLLLSGCAQMGHENKIPRYASAQVTPACQHDPYLLRYHCSVEAVQSAASQGDADAQYALGYMYYYGINTVKDHDLAHLWIGRAAKQGQPLAKQALVLMQDGDGVYPNSNTQSYQVNAAYKRINDSASTKTITGKQAHVNVVLSLPEMEAALLELPATSYTLQIMGNHNLAIIRQFIVSHRLGAKAHYYQTTFDGGKWYSLVYGQYADIAKAHAALSQLPKSLKSLNPWIKPMRDVQSEIRTRHLAT
jgi:DamX protein